MIEKEYYTIGEVSKICNISAKALRYYDQIGIISPDFINEENGYRYYCKETLLNVPVLKYYKQLGFKLEQMKDLLSGNAYHVVRHSLHNKIDELKAEEQELHDSLISVQDWFELVQEAQLVANNQIRDISVKYMPEMTYCYMDQEFRYDYMDSIINIPWTNYLEAHNEKITGPVILSFDSFEEKAEGKSRSCRIIQKAVRPNSESPIQIREGAQMVASIYYIGNFENIDQEYARIREWAKLRGYVCEGKCYERYVVDYWTTRNQKDFVTEIMVPLRKKSE